MEIKSLSNPRSIKGEILNARITLIAGLLLVSGASFGFAPLPRHSEAFTRAYGPKAVVNLSRPTLLWEVWAGEGGKVSSSEMTVDGRSVNCSYQTDSRSLRYTPEGPLAPGSHHVHCQVTIDEHMPVHKDWEFTIPVSAPEFVPIASVQQHALIDAINGYRRDMGLPGFVNDDRLAAAANAHTEYLRINNITGHQEVDGKPGFIGVLPMDRLESFGFLQDSWECVDYGADTQDECLADLFDAPYHRIPFMQPGALLCGTGFRDRHLTVEFEMAKQTATTVSPYPGQQGVPISWSSHERPNPLRIHGTEGPVGYPIVINHFTPEGQKITLKTATLKSDDGTDVPVFLNTPDNDDKLTYSAFIMPRVPLRPGTTYQVDVNGYTESGENFSKSWSFTTVAATRSKSRH